MWLTLAARQGDEHAAATSRELATKLTQDEIARAHRIAAVWDSEPE